jgi:PKD repeat protein
MEGEITLFGTRLLRLACLCMVVGGFFQCSHDNGSSPSLPSLQILSITPQTLSLGARFVPFVISGRGFVTGILVDLGPGIEIVNKEVPDAQTILLTIHVAKSAPTGPRNVVVSDGSNSARLDNSLNILDNHAPAASFIINPSKGTIQTPFQLDASSSTDEDGHIVRYHWEISNGTTRNGIRIKIELNKRGTYTIKLTVTDDKGGISTLQKNVEVGTTKPPVALFTVTPPKGSQLTLFTFDGSLSHDPDGPIQGYRWIINGVTFTGRIVTYRFNKPGQYTVLLRVRDSDGAEAYNTRRMTVEFFDRDKASRQVRDVVEEFLRLFDDIEHLSASQIVVGFSKSPDCFGRNREITIIDSEKPTIRTASVEFLGDAVVEQVNEQSARASITNRFFGTRVDGTQYSSGRLTHHFTLVNEADGWKICNFFVTENGNSVNLQSIFGHKN